MRPAPRGVSPVAASFIASLCQGIRHVPLSNLPCFMLHVLMARVSLDVLLFLCSLNCFFFSSVPEFTTPVPLPARSHVLWNSVCSCFGNYRGRVITAKYCFFLSWKKMFMLSKNGVWTQAGSNR